MTGEQRVGYLVKASRERFVLRRNRSWQVNAWRVVDSLGNDILQPWCDTKGEARRLCSELNIQLIECKP